MLEDLGGCRISESDAVVESLLELWAEALVLEKGPAVLCSRCCTSQQVYVKVGVHQFLLRKAKSWSEGGDSSGV